jgi:DNA-binding HxlR family transcriptional regulator
VAVEYSITPLGRSLQEPFTSLVTWAGKHGGSIEKAQTAFAQRSV